MTTIAIVFGGMSSEHEVSNVSASFVVQNIDYSKFQVVKLWIAKDGKWWIYNGDYSKMRDQTIAQDADNLLPAVISPCSAHHGIIKFNKSNSTYEIIHIDAAFAVLHGKNGEDGTIQGLFELANIPLVGSSTYSSAVCMDKTATKKLCEPLNINMAKSLLIKKTAKFNMNQTVAATEELFEYPVFIKPANAGSSVGITKAKSISELIAGIETAFCHDRKVLIEQAIIGREIEVAVLGNDSLTASICGEIDPNSDFYDYETKYVTDAAKYFIPARLDPAVADKIRDLAMKIYENLDCSGLARVDFFVTENNEIYFNEINTIPGFTAISMYPRLMEESGIPYSKLIEELIFYAINKQ